MDIDDRKIIDHCIEMGVNMLIEIIRWKLPIKNRAVNWKYAFDTLRQKKEDKEAELFYNYFCNEMYGEAGELKTADDIEKFAISAEFKLLKHEDKVKIVKSVESEIPDELKKFREIWRLKNPNKLP